MDNRRALELLVELDGVECELRRQETRLTRMREAIWESCGGARSGVQKNGQRVIPQEHARWTRFDQTQEPTP